jgi:flagellar hook assembly protein FlgD
MEGGELAIYNLLGERIRKYKLPGREGKINWDACDAKGNKVSSGIYFAKARYGSKATSAPQESKAVKLLYLK